MATNYTRFDLVALPIIDGDRVYTDSYIYEYSTANKAWMIIKSLLDIETVTATAGGTIDLSTDNVAANAIDINATAGGIDINATKDINATTTNDIILTIATGEMIVSDGSNLLEVKSEETRIKTDLKTEGINEFGTTKLIVGSDETTIPTINKNGISAVSLRPLEDANNGARGWVETAGSLTAYPYVIGTVFDETSAGTFLVTNNVNDTIGINTADVDVWDGGVVPTNAAAFVVSANEALNLAVPAVPVRFSIAYKSGNNVQLALMSTTGANIVLDAGAAQTLAWTTLGFANGTYSTKVTTAIDTTLQAIQTGNIPVSTIANGNGFILDNCTDTTNNKRYEAQYVINNGTEAIITIDTSHDFLQVSENGNTGASGNPSAMVIKDTQSNYDFASVASVTFAIDSITIDKDARDDFALGDYFQVSGSSKNDGIYKIHGAQVITFVTGKSVITIDQTYKKFDNSEGITAAAITLRRIKFKDLDYDRNNTRFDIDNLNVSNVITANVNKLTSPQLSNIQYMSRPATFVVAASDAETQSKAMADYVCDGTNDHLEIQAAIDALPALGGKIQLTEGTFYINSSILPDSYITIQGYGMSTTLIRVSATATNIIHVNSENYVTIKDLAINGISTNTNGIQLTTATYCIIDNCFVFDNNADGINLISASNFNKIINCIIYSNGDNGIQLDTTCTNNIISNNTCRSNVDKGISVETSCDFNTITGNDCNSNHYGIYLEGANGNTITGNNCKSNYYGIYLISYSNNNTITGNNCKSNTYGIYLKYYSNNNTITGNNCNSNSYGINFSTSEYLTITGNSCCSNLYGILIYGNYSLISGNNISLNTYTGINSSSCERISILSNNIFGNGTYGIYFNNCINNYVYGNHVVNNPSGWYYQAGVKTNNEGGIADNKEN